jgi:hypothetical protein
VHDAEHARFVLVGAVAANLHGSVRATKDVDVLIPKDVERPRHRPRRPRGARAIATRREEEATALTAPQRDLFASS